MTLEVPQLAIPRNAAEPNPTPIFALGYEWTIPSGWRWPDNSVSNGAPRLFDNRSSSTPNRIVVTPPAGACNSGNLTVRVRAVDVECAVGASPGYIPTRSAERTLNINCVVPTLRIATDTPLPTPLTCGDTRDFGFRAEASGVPAGGSFGPYAWTASNGWSVPNPTAQRPGIRPNGNDGSRITLQGRYTRNGFGTDVVAAPLTIGYTSQVAKPTLGGNQPAQLCNGASTELSASAIGATRYEWTPNNPAVQVTPLTANASQVRLTAPAQGAFDA